MILLRPAIFLVNTLKWLVKEKTEKKVAVLIQTLNINQDFMDACDNFRTSMSNYGDIDEDWIFGSKDSDPTISIVRNSILQCINSLHYLMTYCDYYDAKENAIQLGLEEIIDLIEVKNLPPRETGSIYKLAVYDSMAKEIISKYPELKSFTRLAYEGKRKRFSELDRNIISNFCKRIAYKASRNIIPPGIGHGPVKDYTNLALIDKELQKQKRHIPIRHWYVDQQMLSKR